MKNISLTEEEIQNIRAFLYKVDRINLIQCVYILSYFSKEMKKDIFEIISVINYSQSLKENKNGTYSEGTKYLYDKAQDLIKESTNDRLVFTSDTSYNYSIINMSNLNIKASRRLLSGTILLDSFCRFQRIKDVVSDEFEPYPEVNIIDNVEKAFINDKTKTLKKI